MITSKSVTRNYGAEQRREPPPFFGRSYVDLPNPGLEAGVLLDASAQRTGRTRREILTIAQRFMGLLRKRIEEMLELVSLTPEEAFRRWRPGRRQEDTDRGSRITIAVSDNRSAA